LKPSRDRRPRHCFSQGRRDFAETFYTLLHTCATHLLQNEANLRHRSLNTTERHLRLTMTDLRETHRKLESNATKNHENLPERPPAAIF
jgi:integrase